MKKIFIGAIVLALVGVVAGAVIYRPQTSHKMPTSSNSGQANQIEIQSYHFNPSPLKIKKGTTVTWTNMDIAKHNIVVDENQPAGGPTGPLFGKGETFQFTFATAGKYMYHCEPHPYMHGEIEVTE